MTAKPKTPGGGPARRNDVPSEVKCTIRSKGKDRKYRMGFAGKRDWSRMGGKFSGLSNNVASALVADVGMRNTPRFYAREGQPLPLITENALRSGKLGVGFRRLPDTDGL